jgi:hypothetical protein
MTQTSRALVRDGIAQFFGGTQWDPIFKCYRAGPLLQYGLSTVRPYQPKREPDTDYVMGLNPGRGMGAMMVLELAETRDNLLTSPGLPAGIHGGQRRLVYPVKCHVFHLAHMPYAEDAEADIDALDQAIHEHIYTDLTLGTSPSDGPPMIYQAGVSEAGIRTVIDPSENYKEIVATHFRVEFDAEVQIVISS